MLQSSKRILLALLFLAGVQSGSSFSLLGPFPASTTGPDGYQQRVIGYQLGGDIGAPKNVAEEYRRNRPVLYYAFDDIFLNYFGTNGVTAVEEGIAVFNSLTNLSTYSPELTEFPTDVIRPNYQAMALRLRDLKSVAMNMIIEELGLAEADRYVWTLRYRNPGTDCPVTAFYAVTIRNFDPVTEVYTPYINGTLYTYIIVEFCNAPVPPQAYTIPFPVDPVAEVGTPVASIFGLGIGRFYTGLTRDDVAGLRYLLRTNNVNVETVDQQSLQIVTNQFSQLLITSNLATLAAQSITNTAAELETLYPGLIVASTTNFYTNVITTNFTAYFTNLPFSTIATLVLQTNYTTNAETRFLHTFANVVTNTFFSRSSVTVSDTFVTNKPFAPVGTLITNTVENTKIVNNMVSGDFFIIPTNLCGFQVIATQLVSVIRVTNTVPALTNIAGVSNVFGQNFSRDIITYFTNNSLIVYPIVCQTNTVALRQGVDRIRFVRTSYDSLLGQFYEPFTNFYTLNSVTNSRIVPQTFRRVLTEPDFLFSAGERTLNPDGAWSGLGFRTQPIYTRTNINPSNPGATAGPGILEGPITFEFNKVGPILLNNYNSVPFLFGQSTASTNYVWGSFDGSTNAPIVYPDGTSITNLVNQILFSVATTALPDGQVGAVYSGQLQARGGQAPFFWSLAPDSPGLPDGLILSPNGAITGTPTTDGIYDIIVRVMEAGARTSDGPVTITINP